MLWGRLVYSYPLLVILSPLSGQQNNSANVFSSVCLPWAVNENEFSLFWGFFLDKKKGLQMGMPSSLLSSPIHKSSPALHLCLIFTSKAFVPTSLSNLTLAFWLCGSKYTWSPTPKMTFQINKYYWYIWSTIVLLNSILLLQKVWWYPFSTVTVAFQDTVWRRSECMDVSAFLSILLSKTHGIHKKGKKNELASSHLKFEIFLMFDFGITDFVWSTKKNL